MSSAPEQQHLLPPPKPKLSPLELRNTDLVSRLLAATPPYLYNMSLLPNTYFFSEMLRSFVQAKNEQRQNAASNFAAGNGNMFYGQHVRRSRKRAWNHANRENYGHQNHHVEEKPNNASEKTTEKPDNDEPWMIRSMKKSEESAALELTGNAAHHHRKVELQPFQKPPKHEEATATSFTSPPPENSSNLVLPPPPPIWYPPIYPTPPYAIDPLHFFIDLRVSGHIYDRHNNQSTKDSSSPAENSTIVKEIDDVKIEEESSASASTANVGFNQKRHCSAFSVPIAPKRPGDRTGQTKFDVKSMGLDRSSNRTSTNYIMNHISGIYKNLNAASAKLADESTSTPIDVDGTVATEDDRDGTTAEDRKKVKDLRALIGLELVVDYMSQKKGGGGARSDESSSSLGSEEGELSSEIESCGSPQLEVVAVHDDA